MKKSNITSISEYLASLEPHDRTVINTIRTELKRHLPKGIKEVFRWGMISYEIPLSTYPDTYNKQPLLYAALAKQKHHFGLYTMCVYQDESQKKELQQVFKKAGKKLDMGKSCIRFKKLEDIPLSEIISIITRPSVEEFLAHYETVRS